MIKLLSDQDHKQLDRQVAATEKSTGAQIVLAVIKRSDDYPELPWKAFALGASIAGLLMILLDIGIKTWTPGITGLTAVTGALACGSLFAVLTVLLPGFARCFLPADRAENEVTQYAESLFLNRRLFATSQRTGILMLISLFERRVVLLPDTGVTDRLTEADEQTVIESMVPHLKNKKIREAFIAGMDKMSQILGPSQSGDQADALPNAVIEEEGV